MKPLATLRKWKDRIFDHPLIFDLVRGFMDPSENSIRFPVFLLERFGVSFLTSSPPIVFYTSHDEFKSWFEEAGLSDIKVHQRHANSWRGTGVRLR